MNSTFHLRTENKYHNYQIDKDIDDGIYSTYIATLHSEVKYPSVFVFTAI